MDEILPMLLFGCASALTPGPNNFMMLNSGLNFGIKKSMPHYLGICLGFPLMVIVVAAGFGTLFLKYSWIKQVLKVVGSAYILYLAWCIASSLSKPKDETRAKPFSFLQACIFQWVNPKAWLMITCAISLFSPSENQFTDALMLSFLFFVTCLPCLGVWLVGGTFLQKILKNEKQQKIFNLLMALCLVASIWMILID